MCVLEAIYVYPIKSLGGILLREAQLELRGLRYDRRWMLVDEDGRFVTQREQPALARLGTALEANQLIVFEKENPSRRLALSLAPEAVAMPARIVQVWGDRCRAQVYEKTVNEWFSDVLHTSVQLVFMPEATRRLVDGRYAQPSTPVSFADGFPYLIVGLASLDDLNRRLQQPVSVHRFRPNFVFSGGEPYEEDTWTAFAIGTAQFRAVKPCSRCAVVTIDQDTGSSSAEPLQTLATYRRQGHRILFGQNALWVGKGEHTVRIGMPLTKAC